MTLTVVILTKNEERHITRALASVSSIADRYVVVDSGSDDRTVEMAEARGARILVNPFVTQAQQFNWALDQLPSDTEWVLRLDADEIVTEPLAKQIKETLPKLGTDTKGIYVSRRMHFLGRPIRWGGLFPIRVLRVFRHGVGRCEDRWMDEHILVDGATADLSDEIIDDNLNSLTWWTEKHNAYASREVVDLLNLEYGFMAHETVADKALAQNAVSRDPDTFHAACAEIEGMGLDVVELMSDAYRSHKNAVTRHEDKLPDLERRRREVMRDYDALQRARPIEAEVIEG